MYEGKVPDAGEQKVVCIYVSVGEASMRAYTWKKNTHTHTSGQNTPTSVGAVRKRKANKYLLTQQKWRIVVHWWKQKAEDEERRARKPAGCGPCALLVPAWKTRVRREGRTEEKTGQGGWDGGREGRREGQRGSRLREFSETIAPGAKQLLFT